MIALKNFPKQAQARVKAKGTKLPSHHVDWRPFFASVHFCKEDVAINLGSS